MNAPKPPASASTTAAKTSSNEPPRRNLDPLHALHEKADAEFQAYLDIPIVSTFGQPQLEYAGIRKSAAILDQPYRGIIELTGRDRLPFLNNLLTNQVYDPKTRIPLSTHAGAYAFLLDNKGRIVSDLNVLELGERTLLDVDARMVQPLLATFNRYLFSEQVRLNSLLGVVHHLLVTGPTALQLVNESVDPKMEELAALSSTTTKMLGQEVVIFRDDPCGVPGYTILCPTDAAEEIWTRIAPAQTGERTVGDNQPAARPIGWAMYNAARIEAGRPLFGIDFDNTSVPAETSQLERAVSFTKGCYLGQEIVARMASRGQVARQIVGIRIKSDALPIAGNPIFDEAQNQVGVVTSSTISPLLSNAPICLASVKRPFFAPGTMLQVAAEGAVHPGMVVALPFIG